MGIDAVMAVALKIGEKPAALNARFRETHQIEDTLLGGKCGGQNLIRGECPQEIETIEFVNAYYVGTGLSRYYGAGYERGPALRIVTQLEWLRAQPEVIAVYYGGDCSDAPSLWSENDSVALMKHFFKYGHSPYSKWARDSWERDAKEVTNEK